MENRERTDLSRSRPGQHPEPPPDLSRRQLPTITSNGPWFRLHKNNREPLHFGSTASNRFDAPAREYGILYLGSDPHCAFIETYGQSTCINIVTASALIGRCISRVEAMRPLTLVDLTGPGLAQLGADERLCAGEHIVARRWALAIWNHPSRPDGLYYRARHDPSRFCVALYDRAASVLNAIRQGSLLHPNQIALLADILDTYSFGLLEHEV